MKRLALACAFAGVTAFTLVCSAQKPNIEANSPRPLDSVEGDRQGKAMVANLLAQRPQTGMTNNQVIHIGKTNEVPVRFVLTCGPTNYECAYETRDSRLRIVHVDGQANQYFLGEAGAPATAPGKELQGAEIYRPWAGSDFWICDLGLEFLHWPKQRVLRREMRKGFSCNVLESSNPTPTAGGYSRVVSWIAINRPDTMMLIHADAFDAQNEVLKEFDPTSVEKVEGVYQLQEMEMRNKQQKTRTKIEFELKPETTPAAR